MHLSKQKVMEMLDNPQNVRGLYWTIDRNLITGAYLFVGLDFESKDITGQPALEEFKEIKDCLKWLHGERSD